MFKNPFQDKIAAKPEHKILRAADGDGLTENQLEPNEFYFEIRLCEMYVRKSGEAGRSFLPRALTITECLYKDDELTLPVAVGQQILDQIGAQIDTGDDEKPISFSNCLLAGPMPYRGADINFFGGVYRVERGNWADSAFNLVADLTSEFGLNISKYVEVGRRLVGGLPELLDVSSDDWRLGHYGPIYTECDGFFDRYLILLGNDGPPINEGTLDVHREDALETLYIRNGGGSAPFAGRDFALFRLRSRETRGDYTRFEFNKRFGEVKNLLTNGENARAEWSRLQLLQEISECADLTDRHKLKLVAMFDLKFEDWAQTVRAKLRPSRRGNSATRGGGKDEVKNSISALTEVARQIRLPDKTVATFANLANSWDRVSQAPAIAKEDQFSDSDIEDFLVGERTEGLFAGTCTDFVETIKARSLHTR